MSFRHYPRNRGIVRKSAFSLLELLVVIGIVIVMGALVVPAITGIGKAEELTRSAYSIQGILDQARMYAVANNTYTWVGFFEEDSSAQASAVPGIGRVVVCTMTSKDGTSIYNKTLAKASDPTVQILDSSKLAQVGKLIKLERLHMFDASSLTVGSRPAGMIDSQNLVGLSSGALLFSFQYARRGGDSYTFGKRPVASTNGVPVANGIVQFNPQGEAVSDAGPMTAPVTNLEIALRSSHGGRVDTGKNVIALDINGLTGQTTIYRP